MTVSMMRADDAGKQRAFLGLLANPVVAPWVDPDTYTLVHRHAHTLEQWAKRLGYLLAHLDRCYRLRRVPLPGVVSLGHRTPPERSELLLTLYAAACLDDHRDDSITLQELSDLVRLSAAGRGGWPYDPNLRRHRSLFVRAVERLTHHGVIERRTDDQLREGWEHSGAGIGAGYLLHRDALVLFIDTGDVDLALTQQPDESDHRATTLLRLLVEAQAVFVDELGQAERDYLATGNQRARLASLAEEMTGGIVEIRSDAILLSLPPDRALPDSLVIDFPAASARDWAALRLIDRLCGETQGSFRTVPAERVLHHASELHAEAGSRLTAELRDGPQAIADAVAERLCDIGLLRIDHGTDAWVLTPLAGRYRDAHLELGAEEPAQQTLELAEGES